MDKHIKDFIKKHGPEGLDAGSDYALEKTIMHTLKNQLQDMDSDGLPRTLVMDGILLQIATWEKVNPALGVPGNKLYHRVPKLAIFITENWLSSLLHEATEHFREPPMMNLFQYILDNEEEYWIPDTDVLNWELKVGVLRDPSDILRYTEPVVAHSSTVKEYFGYKDDMVGMLIIELADYMS